MKLLKSLEELSVLKYQNKFKIFKTKEIEKTKDNFFENTFAVFKKIDKSFGREADFISYSNGYYYNDGAYDGVIGKGDVSSKYWYTEKGVYRLSDHWGKCASCCWLISDDNSFEQLERNVEENYLGDYGLFDDYTLGFCSWKEFFNLIEKEVKDIKDEEYFLYYEFGYVSFDKKGKDSPYSQHPNHYSNIANIVEFLKIE